MSGKKELRLFRADESLCLYVRYFNDEWPPLARMSSFIKALNISPKIYRKFILKQHPYTYDFRLARKIPSRPRRTEEIRAALVGKIV